MNRLPKMLISILAVLLVLVLVLGVWFMNSPWAVMFTFFADDHRATNFKNMDAIFPYNAVHASAENTLLFEYALSELSET